MPKSENPPPYGMTTLVDYCEKGGLELIIAADSNAHHPLWGMENTNSRGELERSHTLIYDDVPSTSTSFLQCDNPTTSKSCSQQTAQKERRQQKYICKLKAKLKKLSQQKRSQLLKIKCAKRLSFSNQFLMKMEKFPEPIKLLTN